MRYLMQFAALVCLCGVTFTAQAQGTCPPVDRVLPPIDMNAFTIMQDYGVRSPRHDGRYHAGEDWALRDGAARGQPVRAIANGTATYSYPQGWGRDGGVVILEHRLPDDTVLYSVYGHLMQTADAPFPPGSACVSAGDVIGLIGDARPTAHLHFEIRVSNGRSPGQGYTWEYPNQLGYRRPSRVLQNWQAELNRNVEWVTNLSSETGYSTPPLPLSDNSLLIANSAQIARILPDGRQLWRKTYEQNVMAVRGFQGAAFAYFSDGLVQQITYDAGNLGELWQINAPIAAAPFEMNDEVVFLSPTGGLFAVNVRQREITWEVPNIPAFDEVWLGAQVIGIKTTDQRLLTYARSNWNPLDEATLDNGVHATVLPDGTIMVYTAGGLWQILADGVWQLAEFDVPLPHAHGAIATSANGELLLYDGTAVSSYARNGVQQWTVNVPDVSGEVKLTDIDGRTLLYSTGGDVVTVSPLGKVCRIKVWGTSGAYLWHNLGDDDILRVMIGGSLVGINWQLFSRDCI